MIYRGIDADGINQDTEVVSDRTAAVRGSKFNAWFRRSTLMVA